MSRVAVAPGLQTMGGERLVSHDQLLPPIICLPASGRIKAVSSSRNLESRRDWTNENGLGNNKFDVVSGLLLQDPSSIEAHESNAV